MGRYGNARVLVAAPEAPGFIQPVEAGPKNRKPVRLPDIPEKRTQHSEDMQVLRLQQQKTNIAKQL